MHECLYCHAEVEDTEQVPAVDDEAAWEKLAQDHAPDCEWIVTRALRITTDESVTPP